MQSCYKLTHTYGRMDLRTELLITISPASAIGGRQRIIKCVRSNMTCHIPLLELRVDDSVGEALTTDSDALQHTVTLQLVQDQFGIQDTW